MTPPEGKAEDKKTAVPPEFATIEVRGQRFKVKSLTIEEEGRVIALRDDLAVGRWGKLAESPSRDDRVWALLLQAAAELRYAIVDAPDDFPTDEDGTPRPGRLKDTNYLWELWGAYAEAMVRPFRPGPMEPAEGGTEEPGKEGVPPLLVQKPVQPRSE
jgi:hypothetical protein